MQLGRSSRRSIRYSIFIGVLAGSVFSGSGAFAAEPLTQETFYSTIQGDLDGNYVLGGDIDISTADGGVAPAGATVFGTFTGTLDGANKTISGLTKPLFDQLGTSGHAASVTDLVVTATGTEFVGQGILANGSTEALINNVSVSATGVITPVQDNVGGLVGSAVDTQINDSSFSGTITSGNNQVGGLVGSAVDTQIDNSSFAGAISGFSSVGGLVGYTDCSSKTDGACDLGSSTIANSHVTGQVTGYSAIGGLVGGGFGEINNSNADVTISGGYDIGGLIGWSQTSIDQSYSTGSVSSIDPSGYGAGGISGGQGSFAISNSYSTAEVTGASDVGGLVGYTYGDISNSYSSVIGDVTGTGSYVGGLVGSVYQNNLISNSYSYVTGDVTGSYGYVGGLVGYTSGDISNSYSYVTGDVTGSYSSVGGLVGYVDSYYGYGNISNSSSYVLGNVTGDARVGGLVGYIDGNVSNSFSHVEGNVTGTGNDVGGLVGYIGDDLSNSFSHVGGNVSGINHVGGLVGSSDVRILNSHSMVEGDVTGSDSVGGLVGWIWGDQEIITSTAVVEGIVIGTGQFGNLAGTLYGTPPDTYLITTSYTSVYGTTYQYAGDGIGSSLDLNVLAMRTFPTILQTINPTSNPTTFIEDSCYNNGNPYIFSLFESYESSCNGGGGTPPPTRRERIEREFREVLETRTPEKIEKLDGFKKEATVTKDAAIAFVEPTEKIEVTKVKAVEIAATANVRVNAKADEALQISLKSESKEPVELWVKSPDGKWLLAGVITFDKDGKAILPPLKFKNVGNYSLVLSKPTADSAKGSSPLDQTGSLLVVVS